MDNPEVMLGLITLNRGQGVSPEASRAQQGKVRRKGLAKQGKLCALHKSFCSWSPEGHLRPCPWQPEAKGSMPEASVAGAGGEKSGQEGPYADRPGRATRSRGPLATGGQGVRPDTWDTEAKTHHAGAAQ
jgi:hypothetical protein